jgi:Leucine-rich repeat (LRR) protein
MKALFVLVTMLCIVLASVTKPILEQRRLQSLLNRVTALNGRVSNPGQFVRPTSVGGYLLSFISPKYSQNLLYGFDLSGTKVTDADLEWLSQIRYFKELNLSGTQISDAGVHQLRGAEFLTKLDLSKTAVTDGALGDLLTMDLLASLNVEGTSVSYKTLEELDSKLQYAHFCEERAIAQLTAAGIQVPNSTRVIEGDREKGCWIVYAGRTVHHVYVGMGRPTTLTPQDVENLGHLDSLPMMKFHSVKVGPSGLTGLRPLPKLKDLEILYSNVTDSDLMTLAKQKQLESLGIIGCDAITDDGISHLNSLKNLKKLRIDQCKQVSKKATAGLEKELPDCKINRE